MVDMWKRINELRVALVKLQSDRVPYKAFVRLRRRVANNIDEINRFSCSYNSFKFSPTSSALNRPKTIRDADGRPLHPQCSSIIDAHMKHFQGAVVRL